MARFGRRARRRFRTVHSDAAALTNPQRKHVALSGRDQAPSTRKWPWPVRRILARTQDQEDAGRAAGARWIACACAITIFDRRRPAGLCQCPSQLSLPLLPAASRRLIGRSYEDLIRLEIEGGEIAPSALAGGTKPFIAQRLRQLQKDEFAPRDVPLSRPPGGGDQGAPRPAAAAPSCCGPTSPPPAPSWRGCRKRSRCRRKPSPSMTPMTS